MLPQDVDELRRRVRGGESFEYVMFWGVAEHRHQGLTSSCLSQWWPSPFQVNHIYYPTAEHYMMAEKARLFGDNEVEVEILRTSSPMKAKRLGRKVSGFSETLWNQKRFAVVVAASKAKFSQNPTLTHYLLSTGDSVLVEASPTDLVWGIGLTSEDHRSTDPFQWRGANQLGFALMLVREELRASLNG